MAIRTERTPNPSAMKYTVGVPVGDPATYADAASAPTWAAEILAIEGVRSVFATADFVTVTAEPSVDWEAITPNVIATLEAAFA